ncbi:MAG: hypothetical protein IJH59_02775, partial [Firmicutes bacterium]|nr:hypothetical protein [Bacillota bacterium]
MPSIYIPLTATLINVHSTGVAFSIGHCNALIIDKFIKLYIIVAKAPTLTAGAGIAGHIVHAHAPRRVKNNQNIGVSFSLLRIGVAGDGKLDLERAVAVV